VCGAQKHKKDSQVFSLFTLSGSTSVKAERKCVGEIEPMSPFSARTPVFQDLYSRQTI